MNSKEFLNALRKVIREEVSTAVRTELHSLLTESTASKPVVKAPSKSVQTTPTKKSYVKNSLLNDILNETSGHTPSGPMALMEHDINYNDYSEWPTMKSKPMGMNQSSRSVLPMTDLDGRPVNAQNLPDDVVNALTKDYSALMKAIDKKKGK